MSIWKTDISMDTVNAQMKSTLCEAIGLTITEIGDDYIKAVMPVDERTRQYMGIIHGGASVAMAETLGSIGANYACDTDHFCVGLDINANHIRAGRPPHVTGIARPVHIGARTMVWEINIHDAEDRLVCVSRLTTAVLEKK